MVAHWSLFGRYIVRCTPPLYEPLLFKFIVFSKIFLLKIIQKGKVYKGTLGSLMFIRESSVPLFIERKFKKTIIDLFFLFIHVDPHSHLNSFVFTMDSGFRTKLADILIRFSMDLIGVIAEYAHEWRLIRKISVKTLRSDFNFQNLVVKHNGHLVISSHDQVVTLDENGKFIGVWVSGKSTIDLLSIDTQGTVYFLTYKEDDPKFKSIYQFTSPTQAVVACHPPSMNQQFTTIYFGCFNRDFVISDANYMYLVTRTEQIIDSISFETDQCAVHSQGNVYTLHLDMETHSYFLWVRRFNDESIQDKIFLENLKTFHRGIMDVNLYGHIVLTDFDTVYIFNKNGKMETTLEPCAWIHQIHFDFNGYLYLLLEDQTVEIYAC